MNIYAVIAITLIGMLFALPMIFLTMRDKRKEQQ